MKRLFLCALVCAFSLAATAQTYVTGTKVQTSSGILSSGQWCFGASCATVTNGVIAPGFSVTPGTQTITVTNGSGTTYLTIPSVTLAAGNFSWDTYVLTGAATGIGSPWLACQIGGSYTQTDVTLPAWNCVSYNGQLGWNNSSSGSINLPGIYAGAGSPTFSCVSPCFYTNSSASPQSGATYSIVAPVGTLSTNWQQQGGGSGSWNGGTITNYINAPGYLTGVSSAFRVENGVSGGEGVQMTFNSAATDSTRAGFTGTVGDPSLHAWTAAGGYFQFNQAGSPLANGCAQIINGNGSFFTAGLPCALYAGAYASGTTYAQGAIVTYSSTAYLSLVNSNVGNTPSTSPSDWQPLSGGSGTGVPSINGITGATTIAGVDNAQVSTGGSTISVRVGAGASVSGCTAEWPLDDGSGTTPRNICPSSSATLAFASGSNAPSWDSFGVKMLPAVAGPGAPQYMSSSLTTFGTMMVDACSWPNGQLQTPFVDNLSTTANVNNTGSTGTSVGGFPSYGRGQTLWGPLGNPSTYSGVSFESVIGTSTPAGWQNSTIRTALWTAAAGLNLWEGSPPTYGGCHVYTIVVQSGQNDAMYVDGNPQPVLNAVDSYSDATTTSNYVFGSGYGQAGLDSLRGWENYIKVWPTALSQTQVAEESARITNIVSSRAGYPGNSFTPTAGSSQGGCRYVFIGDSLTAGYEGTSSWPSSWEAVASCDTVNLGLGGYTAHEANATFAQRIGPNIAPFSTPRSACFIWLGTNDQVPEVDTGAGYDQNTSWTALVDLATKTQAAGCTPIIATMISRCFSGSESTYKNSWNTLLRQQIPLHQGWYLDDIASNPHIGADGACTNTTYFNATDHTHLTGPGAGTGYQIPLDSANALWNITAQGYWNTGTQGNPTLVTTSTYSMLTTDRYANYTGSSASTFTLPECMYIDSTPGLGQIYQVTNTSAYTVTMQGLGSETITGSTTIPAGTAAQYQSTLTSATAGGCYWQRVVPVQ